jgi:hypothetical protein
MSNADGGSPATKDDIRMLMEEFGKMWIWKSDMDDWRKEVDEQFVTMREEMKLWKTELKDHFDLVAENIRHELVSANREEIEVLKDGHKENKRRIIALEQAVGLAA